jgi:GNAT superfamily N-acetyltransferase
MAHTRVRPASEDDLAAIAAVAIAAGQDEEWGGADPAYVRHLLAHGTVVVGELDGATAGFGATLSVGNTSMLCDLFVNPRVHGMGLGRAMLSTLWAGDGPRRMTFSSLHATALPLYTSFGLDAWWPLLYLTGPVTAVGPPDGWSVLHETAQRAAALERQWTGADRTADYLAWSARPAAQSVVVLRGGLAVAAGVTGGAGAEFGVVHLALAGEAGEQCARDAVLAVIAGLGPPRGPEAARVTLPAPHPAVRPLLASGWRCAELDLHMATEAGLLDPRRVVPSPAMA